MVSKFLKFLNRESSGINEAALLLGLFTFVSQILGLIRDRLLATYVGAGPHLDVYYAAFKIPDFLYVSVATLAAITVLLPYLSERYGSGDADGRARAKNFLNQVFTVLLGFLVILSVILFFAMPWLAKLVAPGFDVSQHATLVMLSRIMLIQPIVIGISNMMSSVTQMFRNFFVASLSPVFYNVGIIVGVVVFYPMFGVTGLAYGVVLGAGLHFIIQIPILVYRKFVPQLTTTINWTEMRQIAMVSIPRTIGLSVSSFTALVLTAIASGLGTGSISLFTLTNNMLNVPIGIIGISYSVASFPLLVKFWNGKESQKFAAQVINAARKIIFWSVPVTFLFIILRAQIVRVILGSKSFSWDNTRLAAACLALFVIGLVAQSLIHLIARGYYAAGNTRRPLMTNIVGGGSIIVLAMIFLWVISSVPAVESIVRQVLRLNGIADIRILALPLGFAIGNLLNFTALWTYFKRDFPQPDEYPLLRTVAETMFASVCLGAVSYISLYGLSFVVNQETFWGIFAQGLCAGIAGMIAFAGILVIIGNRDIMELYAALKHKFWKANVVVEPMVIDK